MSDNKKYYYLKLKDNFFDSPEIKVLESMKNGYKYSNLLLKLYLKSLKFNGALRLNEYIPYNIEMISTVVDMDIDTVNSAFKIFKQLKLIEILENGTIYMLDIQNYIGLSSTEADRKREYRKKIEAEKMTNLLSSGQMSDKNPPEIDTEIEIDTNTDIYTTQYFVSNSKQVLSSKQKDLIETYTHLKLSNNMIKQIQSWDYERLEQAIKIFNKQEGKYFALLKKIYNDNGNFVNKHTSDEIDAKSFNNFKAREYDYDSLEKRLLGWDK